MELHHRCFHIISDVLRAIKHQQEMNRATVFPLNIDFCLPRYSYCAITTRWVNFWRERLRVDVAAVDAKTSNKPGRDWSLSKICHSKSGGHLVPYAKTASLARHHGVNFRFPNHIFFFRFIYNDPDFPLARFWSYYKYKSLRSCLPLGPACVCACVCTMARGVTLHTCGFCDPLMSVFQKARSVSQGLIH